MVFQDDSRYWMGSRRSFVYLLFQVKLYSSKIER